MATAPDQFRLPDGLQSASDPIEANPFPENAPQHEVWSDATRRAEEELCRFNSRLVTERPTPEGENYADWMIGLVVGKFDIWAERGVHVVWSENDVRAYDQWLFNYAQAWLESARHTSPILVQVESFSNELRLRLIERLEFWKGEGRRYLAEQKAHEKPRQDADMEEVDAGELRIQSIRLESAKLTDCSKESYALANASDRRAAVDTYIDEVFRGTGKRITRTDIWRNARYKTRTEFERWQRCDERATKTASQRFARILAEKPHLK